MLATTPTNKLQSPPIPMFVHRKMTSSNELTGKELATMKMTYTVSDSPLPRSPKFLNKVAINTTTNIRAMLSHRLPLLILPAKPNTMARKAPANSSLALWAKEPLSSTQPILSAATITHITSAIL